MRASGEGLDEAALARKDQIKDDRAIELRRQALRFSEHERGAAAAEITAMGFLIGTVFRSGSPRVKRDRPAPGEAFDGQAALPRAPMEGGKQLGGFFFSLLLTDLCCRCWRYLVKAPA